MNKNKHFVSGQKCPIANFFHKVGDMLNLEENEYLIVNPNTGDLIGIYNKDTQIIRNKKQVDYYKKNKVQIEKDKIYDFGQSGSFNMFSNFAIAGLANENLTSSDYRILLLMMSGIGYKTGYISMGNNHSMTNDWIAKKLDVDKKTVNRTIKKLVDRGIIALNVTEKKKSYFLNPYIQYKGQWISKDLYNMFKDTKWAMMAKEEREKESNNRESMKISKKKRGIGS